jgi:hypothetical protein
MISIASKFKHARAFHVEGKHDVILKGFHGQQEADGYGITKDVDEDWWHAFIGTDDGKRLVSSMKLFEVDEHGNPVFS